MDSEPRTFAEELAARSKILMTFDDKNSCTVES